jgi:carboxylesterase type B
VAFQAIIPENRGLFLRVIEQSGTCNSFFSTTPIPHKASDEIVRALNCSNKWTTDIMSCMRNKHSDDVYNAMEDFISISTDGPDLHILDYFAPVVDGVLLKENPSEVMVNHNSSAYDFFKSLDVMIGTCESEGSLIL